MQLVLLDRLHCTDGICVCVHMVFTAEPRRMPGPSLVRVEATADAHCDAYKPRVHVRVP